MGRAKKKQPRGRALVEHAKARNERVLLSAIQTSERLDGAFLRFLGLGQPMFNALRRLEAEDKVRWSPKHHGYVVVKGGR